MDIKEVKKVYSNLEINKTTDDVVVDIKHLNFKHKFKFYLFYAAVVFIGVGSYISIESDIKSDGFKKALIEQNKVAPLFTYFYSDYNSELEELKQLQSLKSTKLKKLESSKVSNFSNNQYSYEDFINDVAANKISIHDMDSQIKSMKVYETYLKSYFTAYVIQNRTKTITINSNEYRFSEFASKVRGLSQTEALEKLQVPSKLILKDMNLDSDNVDYIKALSNALLIIPSINWRDERFFKELTNLKVENAVDDIKKEIFKHSRAYLFSQDGRTGFKEQINIFDEEYNQALEKEKAAQEKRYKEYQANKKLIEDEISSINTDLKLIDEAMQNIYNLQRNVSKYDFYQDKIEKNLDKVGL